MNQILKVLVGSREHGRIDDFLLAVRKGNWNEGD